jgi:hypothetical protein
MVIGLMIGKTNIMTRRIIPTIKYISTLSSQNGPAIMALMKSIKSDTSNFILSCARNPVVHGGEG